MGVKDVLKKLWDLTLEEEVKAKEKALAEGPKTMVPSKDTASPKGDGVTPVKSDVETRKAKIQPHEAAVDAPVKGETARSISPGVPLPEATQPKPDSSADKPIAAELKKTLPAEERFADLAVRPDASSVSQAKPATKNIPYGQEGYEKLLKAPKILKLEQKLEVAVTMPQRKGESMAGSCTQVRVGERNSNYKLSQEASYTEGVRLTGKFFSDLADGRSISHRDIKGIMENLVATLSRDKCILLNLAGFEGTMDDYLFNHAFNVTLLSVNIALASGYSREEILQIGEAALLSDAGMMLVPQQIRNKKGKLNHDEWFEVQKHPILGYALLDKLTGIPEFVTLAAYQHHERCNGSGYPKQRKSRFIHPFAQIIGIADIYEALTSERPHRKGAMPFKAMESLIKMARVGLLDLNYVKNFVGCMSLFPLGSLVRLNTGQVGKVIEANPKEFAKPKLSLMTDTDGNRLGAEHILQVDLAMESELKIVQALPMGTSDIMQMEGF